MSEQTHRPGARVESSGDYAPVDQQGKRTGGPVPLEEGDEFPPVDGATVGWQRVQTPAN